MINSYTKLPYGLYEEILAVSADLPEVDRVVKVIALLTGQTEKQVLNAPLEEFSGWCASARFLDRETPAPGRVAASYACGAMRLVPVSDFRKITTAQFIDFQTFIDGEGDPVVPLLSCLMVPEGCTYGEGYDFAEVREAIRNDLSVADVLSLHAFFFSRYAAFLKDSRTSCARELRRVRDPQKRADLEERLKEADRMLEAMLSRTGGDGWRQ